MHVKNEVGWKFLLFLCDMLIWACLCSLCCWSCSARIALHCCKLTLSHTVSQQTKPMCVVCLYQTSCLVNRGKMWHSVLVYYRICLKCSTSDIARKMGACAKITKWSSFHCGREKQPPWESKSFRYLTAFYHWQQLAHLLSSTRIEEVMGSAGKPYLSGQACTQS